MKYLIFFICLLCFNQLKADMRMSHYYMEGRVFGVDKEPLRNAFIVFDGGKGGVLRRAKTDREGRYTVKIEYILPCMSGGSSRNADGIHRAYLYNSSKTVVHYARGCAIIPEYWSKFYFGNRDTINEKKIIQNIHLHSNCSADNEILLQGLNRYIDSRNVLNKLLKETQTDKFNQKVQSAFYRTHSYIEPIGLTESELFEGLGFDKSSVLVDEISEGKIVLSIKTRFQDGVSTKIYTYFKKNGIITEENVKYEYHSSE